MPRWKFVGDKNICGETGATFQKKCPVQLTELYQ